MKKIMISGLIILSVFLIYLCTLDKKVYYLILGENYSYSKYVKDYLKEKGVLEIYVDEYSKNDLKITDLINDINNNKTIVKDNKEITIKNALVKADLITLSFSKKDVLSRVNSNVYDYIDDMASDLDKLLKLLREYCKEDIILIGFYNGNKKDIFEYLNNKFKDKSNNYNVKYIDVQKKFNGYPDFKDDTIYGQNMIASQIINVVDKKMFKG